MRKTSGRRWNTDGGRGCSSRKSSGRLKRSDERAVIRSRYLDGASWGDVVDLLYGDEEDLLEREDMYRKRVFKLHGRALLSMAQYIEDNGLTWNPDDYDKTE